MTHRLCSELIPGLEGSVPLGQLVGAAESLILVMRSTFGRCDFVLVRALASADAVNLIWDQFILILRPTRVFGAHSENILVLVSLLVSYRRACRHGVAISGLDQGEQCLPDCQHQHKYGVIPPSKHRLELWCCCCM